MKLLLKNGTVINIFTDSLEKSDVLIENGKIVGVGNYSDTDADVVEDVSGKYISPAFIDGHIHIESTMLTPYELAKICLPRGTVSIFADPHEIANVCGADGIKYMLQASENLPMNVYFNLPSCVPATPFDESGANLLAEDLQEFYQEKRVVGLAEMMNFPGVISQDKNVVDKITDAYSRGKVVDGHAPMLSGKSLDKYISSGIQSDHECSSFEEAREKLSKGQWIMIRQGTAARNLESLLPLFSEPYNRRCLLVTDDGHPADIVSDGHIDNIVRQAVALGVSPIVAIRMATFQAAQCFGLRYVGAIAPSYRADILVLSDLNTVDVCDVYSNGKKVVNDKKLIPFVPPSIDEVTKNKVNNSFNLEPLSPDSFYIEPKSALCRVIKVLPGELVTKELQLDINWSVTNGIDLERDILKLAVIERHNNTGHMGLGFINGIGLKKGAIASSVSHDSHNIIVIGTNERDMSVATNHIRKFGGNVVVCDDEIIADMPLEIAGLMTDASADVIAKKNLDVRSSVYDLGVNSEIEPFMNMAFVSLAVIPSLKMTTTGLIDVDNWQKVSLYI